MAAAPQPQPQPMFALVLKSTFFHLEVSGSADEPEATWPQLQEAAGRRRAASAPPGRSHPGTEQWSAAPVYVADTWCSAWRRPISGAASAEFAELAEPPAMRAVSFVRETSGCVNTSTERLRERSALGDLRADHGCSSDPSTAASDSASADLAEPPAVHAVSSVGEEAAYLPPLTQSLSERSSFGELRADRRYRSDSSTTASSLDDPDSLPAGLRAKVQPALLMCGSASSAPSSGAPTAEAGCSALRYPAPEGLPEDAGAAEDIRTTVMMRNVPHSYSRDELRALLDAEGFSGRFDFLYLPVDFATAAMQGYAFVNLTSPAEARRFRDHFSGFRQWGVRTGKVCNVSWANANQQGFEANIERYRNSSVMHKSVAEEFKPMLLIGGVPVKFPKKTKRLWPPHESFGIRAARKSS